MKLFNPILLLSFVVVFSCSKDDEPEPEPVATTCDGSNLTYNTGISTIISSNCTASNCHGSGSPQGAWTTYAGMQGVISSGAFNTRVLVNQDMPQGSAVLTKDQLNKLKCWVNNGFPEN